MNILETTIYSLVDWIIANPTGSEEDAVGHVMSLNGWSVEEVGGFFNALGAELVGVQWVADTEWDTIRDKVIASGEGADKALADLLIKSGALEKHPAVKIFISRDHIQMIDEEVAPIDDQISAGNTAIGNETDADLIACLQAGVDMLTAKKDSLERQKSELEGLILSLGGTP